MMRLTYVGHATLLIEMDGQRFLTDPLLTPWIGPLRRQGPPVDPGLTRNIDAVLLSHIHHDHFHLPSLTRVDPDTPLVVPTGSGSLLRNRPSKTIHEVSPGDRFTVGDVDVQVVPAEHDASRPFSRMSAEPQGFMLHGSQTVYFAGDTDVFPEMAELHSEIDVVLIPIWGWGPTLGAGHLDPVRAAESLTLIQPRIAIPIHWGTYFPAGVPWRRKHAMTAAPALFSERAEQIAPEVDVQVVEPGGTILIPERRFTV